MINKPLDENAVTDVCIRIMDFLVPEDPNKEEDYDFEAQDEIKEIVKAWLRENSIPFVEEVATNGELKEYTCNIVLDFGRSYMAKSKEEFIDMVLDDFYREHGYKLSASELKNIQEVK